MKQFDVFRLDKANECLWRESVQISLPPKPWAILCYLVDNPARLITHDELLDALWPETYVQPQVLRTYMLELRKVLGDDAGAPRFIQTLPKRGYCFVAPVREGAPPMKAAPQGTNASGLPVSSLGDAPVSLVNREAELMRLDALVQLAAAGQRQIVLVTGTAGIGKTALLDGFAARVEAAHAATVARGQCVEGLGGREEYYPVTEALAQLCASPDGERACRALSRMAPRWLPAAGDPVNNSQGVAKAPGDLCAALEELSADRPLLLVFEDLHWADSATCALISALARRRASAKLMILATWRPQDSAAEPAFKALRQDLLLRRLCVEIPLAPFGRTQVASLLRRHLGQDALPVGLNDFVYDHSEGNPLFVIAMLEHLVAQQYLVPNRDASGMRWRQATPPLADLGAAVPDELAQMIELEIERLSPRDQRLLEAASLMPVAFPAWAVAAALAEDPADIEEICDELARRLYFVRRAGEDELPDGTRSGFYVFAHGLYREVLHQRQAAARRARRHIRIAERLKQLFAGREHNVARELAQHYEAAGDWQQAAQVLRAAAQSAAERHAHSEAVALLDSACCLAVNLDGDERMRFITELRAEQENLRAEDAETAAD